MKIKLTLLFFTALAITGIVYAQVNQIQSLGFLAPLINGKANVPYPAVGEIVYDTSDATFWGYTQSLSWAQLGSSGGSAMPAGSVIPFAGTSAPSGYLVADGSAVSRTTYADLFAVIGTTFGAGDGSTTFNLPDLRGIFIRGAGSQTISSVTYSGTYGTKQGDQLQGHHHDIPANFSNNTAGNVNPMGSASGTSGYLPSAGAISDGTNGTPRVGSETRPANISLTYIIKI